MEAGNPASIEKSKKYIFWFLECVKLAELYGAVISKSKIVKLLFNLIILPLIKPKAAKPKKTKQFVHVSFLFNILSL